MNKIKDMDLFLSYLKEIYSTNPSLDVLSDTIYNELCLFYVSNGKRKRIKKENLLKVQVNLKDSFPDNTVISGRNRYFYTFENRCGKSDSVFYREIQSSIEIFVASPASKIYEMASKVFNFIINNNIVCQCKIAKVMRNDAFVIRVSDKEKAKMIIDYINSLEYNSDIKPNPFIFNTGNVGVVSSRELSYTNILSLLLRNYFIKVREEAEVDSYDFANFIESELLFFESGNYDYFYKSYGISFEDVNSFINSSRLIMDNIRKNLTLDDVFSYSSSKSNDDYFSFDDKSLEKLLYVIYRLSNYYNTSDVHKMMEYYSKTGNADIFTRRDSIRYTVVSSISPVKLKYMVMKIGTNALYDSVRLTLDKYDDKQCIYAIEKFILTGLLDGFTRDDGVRNKLGLVVPRDWLNDIMMNELDGKNKDIFKVINRLSNVDKKKIMSSIDNDFSDINEEEVSKIMEVRSYIEIIASSIYDSIFLKINKDDDKKIGRK